MKGHGNLKALDRTIMKSVYGMSYKENCFWMTFDVFPFSDHLQIEFPHLKLDDYLIKKIDASINSMLVKRRYNHRRKTKVNPEYYTNN